MATVMPPDPDMNGIQNEHEYCENSDGVMFFAQAALLYLTMEYQQPCQSPSLVVGVVKLQFSQLVETALCCAMIFIDREFLPGIA